MEIEERDLGNQKTIYSSDQDGDYEIKVSGLTDGNGWIGLIREGSECFIEPDIEEVKALRDLLNEYLGDEYTPLNPIIKHVKYK